MKSNWYIYNKRKNFKEISDRFKISNLLSIVLCNRDIVSDNEIKMMLSSDIHDIIDEKLLPDIDKAVDILHEYINDNKNIRIVGDYDIDGICSTYILYDSLKSINANVSYAIPDRIIDGYGINNNIIDKAINDKVDLIITCDNGISSEEQISYALKNNIKVIVTDHHDINDLPKSALAVINPKREDVKDKYPFKEICGAFVAMKFIMRYYDKFLNGREQIINKYLDFAMLATVGDIMPLINENHIIVKIGLKSIKNTKNKGLKKLLSLTDLLNKELSTYHIGFIIGPLINAAGRMDSATLALELFLSNDDNMIDEIAKKMQLLNNSRKLITEEGYNTTVSEIEKKYKNDKVLVVYIKNLPEQVAGIVAGRIKEKYYKPTIILTDTCDENEAKASCRSIDAYDIYSNLCSCKELFLKFGGHKLAAGFSILKNNIDILRKTLNDTCKLKDEDYIPKVHIDVEYPFYNFDLNKVKELNTLEPYGQGFAKPIFATKNVTANIKNIYGESKNIVHMNLLKDNNVCKSVAFLDSKPLIDRLDNNNIVDILYYPKINEFKGSVSIEYNIIDYR